MTSLTRIARATACAAVLAIPATGLGAEATIRIEGTSSTVLPETAYVLPAAGTSLQIQDTGDGETAWVGGRTAAAQLGNASRLYGIGFRFSNHAVYGFGLEGIGSDLSDWDNGPVWFLKHNHRLADVGASSLGLEDGDEVLWALTPLDANWNMAYDELDLQAPAAPLLTGQAFTVRVNSYDNEGVRTPASGAGVSYRGATVTTGLDGTAVLTSGGSGPASVVATRPGSVHDVARVCAHPADDPGACDLPPPPKATMPDSPSEGGDTLRLPVTIRVGGADITLVAEVPLPEVGGRPVVIRRQMIGGADLTPAEMRLAIGAAASALAATLNDRAARGDAGLVVPSGSTWRPSWLSGAPYVVPLRRDEALLGARSGGPRNTRAMDDRAAALRQHIRRCGLDATATRVRRHGYALTALSPASARHELVTCVEGGR